MLIYLVIGFFAILVGHNAYAQNTTTTTIAEDFKDCFLDLKSNSDIYGLGINNLIKMLCYETYKGEGVFNHQLSKEQVDNMNNEIINLTKSSDLDKILKAFR